MKDLSIKQIIDKKEEYDGKTVVLKGWVYKVRAQSKFSFLVIRDISGTIQCFVDNPKALDVLSTLPAESVVTVVGKGKAQEQAPDGFEVAVEEIIVLSKPVEELPFAVYEKGEINPPSLPTRLDSRWVDLRKPKNALIFKVSTAMIKYMREYWSSNGFIEIHSPKLIAIPSEGGAEAFTLDYFGRPAYLAQSPQFYKQMAMASGFEKVFEIAPVFRAENSLTGRHATEFVSIDMEMSFVDNLEEMMELEEDWIIYWLSGIKKEYGEEIKELFGTDIVIPQKPFPRITFDQAMEILGKKELDLGTEDEKALGDHFQKEYGHEFVFVYKWPWEKKPFYHLKMEGEEYSDTFDLLWKGLEITTCSRRENRYDVLVKQAEGKGINKENFETFFQFFKYGCPPHAGMGVGASRLLLKMFNLDNIREVSFIPRDPKRLTP